MIHVFKKTPKDLIGSRDIRIIGPRASGKTAFMAALARWPNAKTDCPIMSVDPFDDESNKLVYLAKDILENGLPMAATSLPEDANSLPLYSILIQLKPAFVFRRKIQFQVSCREYSGEIIKDLREDYPSVILQNYLNECADNSSGLLLLIDGTSHQKDDEYSQAFAKLQQELNELLIGKNKDLKSYRVAVVFSKAEQAEVWNYRYDMQTFNNLKFFRTKKTLQEWSRIWGCPMNYFFCSAFGMRGRPPRPNVKVQSRDDGGTYGVIANPSIWRPFGLVAPIYWLHTGKDDQRLRQIEE